MNSHSISRLQLVHPKLRDLIYSLTSRLHIMGYSFEVIQGLRTIQEQNRLYSQGRSAPGPIVTNARGGLSYHNYGLAVDLCPIDRKGSLDWKNHPAFLSMGMEAQKLGLEWGGGWHKLLDLPHVNLRGLSIAQCRMIYDKNDGDLKKVWEAWEKI